VHSHNDFAYGPLTVVDLVWLVGWVGFHGLNIPAAFPIFRFFVFSFYNMAGHHGVVWLRAVLHSNGIVRVWGFAMRLVCWLVLDEL